MKIINNGGWTYSYIDTKEDLKELAQLWKELSINDDKVEGYTKTAEDAIKMFLSPDKVMEKLAQIRSQGKIPDVIVHDKHPITVMLTADEYHKYQWHVSLGEVSQNGFPSRLNDDTAKSLLRK